MLRHIARRITSAAVQAELADDAELQTYRDGLAPRDARGPAHHRFFECRLAVFTPVLRNEAHEAIEDELSAPVAHPHRALEAQEVLLVSCEPSGGHDRGHVGTGSETSRSDSVAILTYAETDSGSRCPSRSESTRGRVPMSSWRAAFEWRRTWLPR